MDIEKETASAGNVVADKAAEIVCAWLAKRGFELVEIAEIDSGGHKRNSGMEIRPDPKKSVCMDKMFSTWDWAGSLQTPDKAWLIVVNWLFNLSLDGPSWILITDESRPSPGRVVIRRKKFPIPKLAFSGLEEFVLKAAVLPDFRENP